MSLSVFSTVVKTSRPPFLLLAISAVSLSVGMACVDNITLNPSTVFSILIAAVCAHIAVNMHNEYYDHQSQLDFDTQKTPFSGGSGALQRNERAKPLVLGGSFLALGITCAIGLYFVITSPLSLFLGSLGFIAVCVVVLYTPMLNRFPLLCLLSPGFGFGIAITMGSYVVMAEQITVNSLLAGILMSVLANNLLLLNQLPDVSADRAHGRNHWIICYGIRSAARIYCFQWCLALLAAVFLTTQDGYSLWMILAVVPLLLGLVVAIRFMRLDSKMSISHSTLAMNVMCAVITPLTLGITLCAVG